MDRPAPSTFSLSVAEKLNLLGVGLLAFNLVLFPSYWSAAVAIAFLILIAVSALRQQPVTSLPFFLTAIITLCAAVSNSIPKQSPLQQRLTPAHFANVPLAIVLQHLSTTKSDRPKWIFQVSTRALANKRVSLTIDGNMRLYDLLDEITKQIDGKYDWHWGRYCGNSISADFPCFQFCESADISLRDFGIGTDRGVIKDADIPSPD